MKRFFVFLVLSLIFCWFFTSLCMAVKTDSPVNPLRPILNRMDVQNPIYYKGLTIFPVTSSENFPVKDVLCLEDALKEKVLEITEVSSGGQVNTLLIENKSSVWVFIMAGEILTGCKQDRILKSDLLLPSHSGKIKVSAYCTEHGRWDYKSDKFSYQGSVAPQSVRQKACETKSQSGVWDSISKMNKSVLGASEGKNVTGTLNFAYQDKEVEKNIKPYFDKFKGLPHKYRETMGVVVAIDGDIICADFFGNAALFEKIWPKLLKSYIMEAISRDRKDKKADRKDAELFLTGAIKTEFNYIDNPGEGKLIEVNSSEISGEALIYQEKLVHTGLFPKISDKEMKDIPPIQRNY